MGLSDDLARIAAAASTFAAEGEELEGVLAAEPATGSRTYLCAFVAREGGRSWLALDDEAQPLATRAAVRETVSIAAMCEIAEDSAGGGDLADLRAQLVALRLTEQPEGIEEAEAAALDLERVIDRPPRVATPRYLDAVGAATRRLERALGDDAASPFALAMREALPAVDELTAEVERNYKLALD